MWFKIKQTILLKSGERLSRHGSWEWSLLRKFFQISLRPMRRFYGVQLFSKSANSIFKILWAGVLLHNLPHKNQVGRSWRCVPAWQVGQSKRISMIEFLLLLNNYAQYKRPLGLKWFLIKFSTILHFLLNYHV